MGIGGRNDMQRINGLRIEEESRRKDEETAAGAGEARTSTVTTDTAGWAPS